MGDKMEGKTIGEIIKTRIIEGTEKRYHNLVRINAPAIMIERQKKMIDEVKQGKIKINGDNSLLQILYISDETKKGNGGKVYFIFNGIINYFPNAQYGRFISKIKDGE